jgi:chromosome segregation ATPase
MKTQFRSLEKAKEAAAAKEIDALHMQIESLRSHMDKKDLTVEYLTKSNDACESRLIDTTRKLEKTVKTNKMLLDRASNLDETLNETHKRWLSSKRDMEGLERWVRSHKTSLEDYDGAVKEADIFSMYPEEVAKDFLGDTPLLTRYECSGYFPEKRKKSITR